MAHILYDEEISINNSIHNSKLEFSSRQNSADQNDGI